jgi:hypothetical protein
MRKSVVATEAVENAAARAGLEERAGRVNSRPEECLELQHRNFLWTAICLSVTCLVLVKISRENPEKKKKKIRQK